MNKNLPDGTNLFIRLKSNSNALTTISNLTKKILAKYKSKNNYVRIHPLLITSKYSGLGKTHLCHIFSSALKCTNIYSCYAFQIKEFSQGHCEYIKSHDVLIIEDLYYPREFLNHSFRNIVNSFYQKGKPVLVVFCETNISLKLFLKCFPYFNINNKATLEKLDFEDKLILCFEFRKRFGNFLFSDNELIRMAKDSRSIRDIEGKFHLKTATLRIK